MRKETVANKLLDLLGLKEEVQELPDHYLSDKSLKKKRQRNLNPEIAAVREEDIQSFREAQGIHYFLQAPALFTPKVCKHCNASFLVSRKFVAFCSYTCIRKDLEKIGLSWDKGRDIEALVQDPHVYDGNEPIWIRDLDKLKAALQKLANAELVS